MESKVKLAGHAVHPMLIVFPLGLLATSVGFDLVSLVGGNPRWTVMAFYLIGVGVAIGLLAAVPGWLDWWAIPRAPGPSASGCSMAPATWRCWPCSR